MSEACDGAPLLRARDLALGYGADPVLAGVDCTIRPGDFWFLLGPNGAGKTTLLRGFLGLLEPQSGSIERHPVLGQRERLGFVPQRCDLNPSLSTTVREFVLLGLVGTAIAEPARSENLRWALERVGLGDRADADHWSLSGGQHRRALMARALVRRPSLLILDEPTEGLDFRAEQALLATLADLNRGEGVTLLVVTHKLELASRFATHVALFHAGGVRCGTREQVLRTSEIERAFGTPGAGGDPRP